MLRSILILLISAAPLFAQSPDEPKFNAAEAAKREGALVSRTRQLTFEGRRAGEGYFDSTGSRIVFQSERQADNPFYQIYLMDLDTGDTDRISPGTGKTTCAWIHPTANRVLFASTHGDSESVKKQKDELDFRASGKERRYSWDYDENYDIYDFDVASKKYVNLTNVRGYDAEGSWSPDGKLIAFASNRNAYSKSMSDEDKKKFEIDPAWAMDIFLMNADGSNVRQLTDVAGYDGGPFFSADGKKICWRRFSENGLTAEIMTMDIDGSNQKQLTKINAMSWAPYFHPTGEYLIFTTNRHGFGNFELYLVRADGAGEPVRVTYTDKFDGLPTFTPDGTKLSWTTQRSSSGNSQIFLAEWNHKAARKLLGLDGSAKPKSSMAAVETRPEFAPADVVQHVEYLCKPELNGRMTGTEGARLATDYVANYFDALGLKPAGEKDGWFQPFEFVAGARLGEKNQLVADGKELKVGEDWQPLAFSAKGDVAESGVVFGGYGLVAPKKDKIEEYDSFVHLDVKDKWVLVFRFLPEDVSDEMRQHLSKPDPIRFKSMLARDRGARGLIVVSGPTSQVRSQLVPLRHDGASGSSLPVISVTDEVAAKWLAKSGKDLGELQKKLDSGAMVMGFEIKDLKIAGSMDVQQVTSMGRNVVGRLQFGDKPSEQAIVIGAHVDHLGKGPAASSMAKGEERGGIHFGADDNASGVAAMLEVAEYFSDNRVKMAAKAKRDIIFAAWSGEELGLLGSKYYVENYDVPMSHGHGGHGHAAHGSHGAAAHGTAAHGSHGAAAAHGGKKANPHAVAKSGGKKSAHGGDPHAAAKNDNPHAAAAASAHGSGKKAPRLTAMQLHGATNAINVYPWITACLNMDMVGRMEDKLVLQGIGSSDAWRGEIERRNAVVGLNLKLQEDCDLPTDASSFYKGGVPILAAFTGSHKDYHTPRDTPNKLNYEGTARIARFMALIARGLVLREEAIAYKVHETKSTGDGTKASLRATLGTVPEYGDDVKGVLIGEPRKGFAAEKAGLKAGDVIVELAGKKVENIYDYTYAIEALKIGRETTVAVTRDGKRMEFKITPTSRN